MAQIKDTNIIKTPKVVVNPVFFLPENVEGASLGFVDTEFDSVAEDSYTDSVASSTDSVSLAGSGSSVAFQAPQWMTVVSQSLRMAPDGSYLVDVVIEVEDITGANTYEVRLSQ